MKPRDEPTSGTGPAGPVHVALPQDGRAPAQARRATREALIAWHLPQLVDTVVLAVSELVTNAVRYGRPVISLELVRRSHHVRVAVHDGDPTEPPAVSGEVSSDAEHGRGLAIVRELADDLAVEQRTDDGKVVRVDFDASVAREPET